MASRGPGAYRTPRCHRRGQPVGDDLRGAGPRSHARERWRFTTTPGRNYLLSTADWANPDAVAEILAPDPVGLRLRVTIERGAALLELVPGTDGRLGDDCNRRWSQAFTEEADLTATPVARTWSPSLMSPPDGLPGRIPVDGLTQADTLFEVSGWNEYQQRRGRILGDPLRAHEIAGWDDEATRTRLRELRNIQPGDQVWLDKILTLRPRGLSVARTRDGVAVRVETESLSLLPLREGMRFTVGAAGRRATVYRVKDLTGTSQRAVPMSTADLAERCVASRGGAAPATHDLAGTLHGAIVRRLQSRQAGQERSYWGVWLQIDTQVRYCEVPDSAFDVRPIWPGLGDLLTADSAKAAGSSGHSAAR